MVFTAVAVLTGIQQFLGGACEEGYTQLATSYSLMVLGCRLGNGLGIVVLITLLFVFLTFIIRIHDRKLA
jgi:hypothetical protein